MHNDYLAHYGVMGMKWGVRKKSPETRAYERIYRRAGVNKYRNSDHTGMTPKGLKRYGAMSSDYKSVHKGVKRQARDATKTLNAYDRVKSFASYNASQHNNRYNKYSRKYDKKAAKGASEKKLAKLSRKIDTAKAKRDIADAVAKTANKSIENYLQGASNSGFRISKRRVDRYVSTVGNQIIFTEGTHYKVRV